MTQDTTQSVLFPELFSKPILASFDQLDSSSDGGAILLKGIDSKLSLTERLAQCIDDSRESSKVSETLCTTPKTMLVSLSRIFGAGPRTST